MGIRPYAAIIVGLTVEEMGERYSVQNEDDDDTEYGFMKDGEFVSFDDTGMDMIESCWDTEDPSEQMYGFPYILTDDPYTPMEIETIDLTEIEELKAKFKEATGMDAKVYITPWMM